MEELLNTIINDDNAVAFKNIPADSLDLIITSPPYKDSDGYNANLVKTVFRNCYRILKPNSLFFLNFGHLAEDKFRPFKVCEMAIECGFELNDTIVWVKNHYKPIQGKKRLNNLTEFIFMLYKGNMPQLSRLAIGVPYADKTNAKRFAGGLDLKCGGNIWYIPYDTIQSKLDKLHNDRFPLGLPLNCIKLANLKPNSIVFDPYTGSGTTLVAAKSLGFNFLGIERNLLHYHNALYRLGIS